MPERRAVGFSETTIVRTMIVADANIVLSALRSRNGASHAVLRGMLSGDVPFAISSAVILEYESVLKRPGILGGPLDRTGAD
jgi:predicted nucleic acid-binding protein